MYVCNTITLESLDVESSFFDHSLRLEGIRVKFVYEGHRIKVKVTGAKQRNNPCSCSVKLPSAITPVM